ncbi:MAG: hypothetical protein ANABAC_1243 [Anaerolineae bacterium]|nr:MAG: hypothetical protein ANABAC_1243 [Anaerolineae bacterium]
MDDWSGVFTPKTLVPKESDDKSPGFKPVTLAMRQFEPASLP